MRSIEAQAATTDKAVQKALESLGLRRDQVTVEVLREAEPGSFLGIGRKDALVRVTEISHETETQAYTDYEASESRLDDDFAQETYYEEGVLVTEVTPSETSKVDGDITVENTENSGDANEGNGTSDNDAYAPLSEDKVQAWNELLAMEGKKPAAVLARAFIEAVLQLMHLDGALTVSVNEDKTEGTLLVDVDGDDCGILIGRRGATLSSLQYMLILLLHRHAQESYFVQLDIGGYHRRRREGLEDLARQTAKRALETGNAYELNPMRAQDRRIIHETLSQMDGIITYSEGQGRNRFVVIDLEDYAD